MIGFDTLVLTDKWVFKPLATSLLYAYLDYKTCFKVENYTVLWNLCNADFGPIFSPNSTH